MSLICQPTSEDTKLYINIGKRAVVSSVRTARRIQADSILLFLDESSVSFLIRPASCPAPRLSRGSTPYRTVEERETDFIWWPGLLLWLKNEQSWMTKRRRKTEEDEKERKA